MRIGARCERPPLADLDVGRIQRGAAGVLGVDGLRRRVRPHIGREVRRCVGQHFHACLLGWLTRGEALSAEKIILLAGG